MSRRNRHFFKGYDDFCSRLEWQAERAEKAHKNIKSTIDSI